MAKKKAQYPNKKRNIIIACVSAAVVLAGAVTAYFVVDSMNYIASVDGEKIYKGEYVFEVMSQKAEIEQAYGEGILGISFDESGTTFGQQVEANIRESMVADRVIKQMGKAAGVSLTAEQKTETKTTFQTIKSNMPQSNWDYLGIKDRDLRNAIEHDYFRVVVFEEYTKDYQVDQEALDAAFAEYLITGEQEYKTVVGTHIYTETLEEAEAAKQRIEDGEDVWDIRSKYTIDYNLETEGEFVVLSTQTLPQSAVDAAYQTEVKNSSEIVEVLSQIESEDAAAEPAYEVSGYVFVYVDSVEAPSEDELKAGYTQGYVDNAKEVMFSEILNGWIEEKNVVYNDKIIGTVSIDTL